MQILISILAEYFSFQQNIFLEEILQFLPARVNNK